MVNTLEQAAQTAQPTGSTVPTAPAIPARTPCVNPGCEVIAKVDKRYQIGSKQYCPDCYHFVILED